MGPCSLMRKYMEIWWALLTANTEAIKKGNHEVLFWWVFWKEPMKATALAISHQMKWHTLFIKGCLFLWQQSSSAYYTVKQSGCLKLPYPNEHSGIISCMCRLLSEGWLLVPRSCWLQGPAGVAEVCGAEHRWMHIKEDLIYKNTETLIRFININEHLLEVSTSAVLSSSIGEKSHCV